MALVKADREQRRIIFRDVMIFQLKLLLDGLKDIVLSPVALMAAVADVIFPTDRVGKRFYHVLRVGEKFDQWISLYGAAEKADAGQGGLFGASRAGSSTLLGQLESLVMDGHEKNTATDDRLHDRYSDPIEDSADSAARDFDAWIESRRAARATAGTDPDPSA